MYGLVKYCIIEWRYNLKGFVAFESISQPGSFIRHQDGRLKVHVEDDDHLYKNDASFEIVTDYPGIDFIQQYFLLSI